jgi:hypothetical protein
MDLADVQDHARVGTPPEDRILFAEPGKHTLAIRREQALGRQIAAGASRPFGTRSAESTGGKGSSGERNGITE